MEAGRATEWAACLRRLRRAANQAAGERWRASLPTCPGRYGRLSTPAEPAARRSARTAQCRRFRHLSGFAPSSQPSVRRFLSCGTRHRGAMESERTQPREGRASRIFNTCLCSHGVSVQLPLSNAAPMQLSSAGWSGHDGRHARPTYKDRSLKRPLANGY